MPEINIPDVFLHSEDKSSSIDTDSTEATLSSQRSVPSLNMDDVDISDIESESIPTLKVDEGLKLYDGARVTAEQAIYTLVSWFSSYPGVNKSAFSRLLYILHSFILPAENNLPPTYADLMKSIRPFLSPVKDYHCCVNDCVVFHDSHAGEYADLSKCPECDEDHYEPGTVIPRKRFKYMPLENRVRRLFANEKTSQLLQTHSSGESSVVCDIHQSEAWNSWYSTAGVFKGDHRGLSFAICMDGLNPFSREKSSYTTCPLVQAIEHECVTTLDTVYYYNINNMTEVLTTTVKNFVLSWIVKDVQNNVGLERECFIFVSIMNCQCIEMHDVINQYIDIRVGVLRFTWTSVQSSEHYRTR